MSKLRRTTRDRRDIYLRSSHLDQHRQGASASPGSKDPTLPIECIVIVARELLDVRELHTLANLLRISKGIYDAVAPILYRRLEVTDRTLIPLFYGLDHRTKSSILGYGGLAEHRSKSPTLTPTVTARTRYLLSLVEEIVLRPKDDTYGESFACLSRTHIPGEEEGEEPKEFSRQSMNRSWLISQISGTSDTSSLFPRLKRWDADWLFDIRLSRSREKPGFRLITVTFGERDISLDALRTIIGTWGSAQHIQLKIVFRPHEHFRLAPPIRTRVSSRRKECGETCARAGLTLAAHVSELMEIIVQYRVSVEVEFYPHPVDHTLGPLMQGSTWEAYQGHVRSLLVHLGFGNKGPIKEDHKGIRQKVTVVPPQEMVSGSRVIEPPPETRKSHPIPLVLHRQISVTGGDT